jgi:predicted NAD/FAD-dependent oxidoreductase
MQEGVAAPWSVATSSNSEQEGVWVGTPTNHAMVKGMADTFKTAGGTCLFGRHVLSADFQEDAREWVVRARERGAKEDEEYRMDALVLSDKLLVLPNLYAVLSPGEAVAAMVPPVPSMATLVVMLAFHHSLLGEAGAETGVLLQDELSAHSPLSLVVHDSAKPGRDSVVDQWVIHSTAAYADTQLTEDEGAGDDNDNSSNNDNNNNDNDYDNYNNNKIKNNNNKNNNTGPSVRDEALVVREMTKALFSALKLPPPTDHR